VHCGTYGPARYIVAYGLLALANAKIEFFTMQSKLCMQCCKYLQDDYAQATPNKFSDFRLPLKQTIFKLITSSYYLPRKHHRKTAY